MELLRQHRRFAAAGVSRERRPDSSERLTGSNRQTTRLANPESGAPLRKQSGRHALRRAAGFRPVAADAMRRFKYLFDCEDRLEMQLFSAA